MARPRPPADDGAAPASLVALAPGRFALSGDIGFGNSARLLAEGDAAFGSRPEVEVDLAQIARFDSAGLALLLEWALAAGASGRSLRYLNVPPAVSALAGISDVSEMLAPGGEASG